MTRGFPGKAFSVESLAKAETQDPQLKKAIEHLRQLQAMDLNRRSIEEAADDE